MNRLCIFAVLSALMLGGCAQVSGHVQGRSIASFVDPQAAPTTCAVKITRLKASTAASHEVGVILVEAGGFTNPADMDAMLRAEGCKVAASELVVLDEAYGQPFVGSFARAAVLMH